MTSKEKAQAMYDMIQKRKKRIANNAKRNNGDEISGYAYDRATQRQHVRKMKG